ncbi:T6SS amidase immunity protein Tai4 family protein [Rheinheimera pleomorphica]|uniref:T6SS amidase immunity protein Tai4 family protein n=1 Tax=Rheinheimera pleomorphica TaxID=2703963 RepID=UPI0014217C1B|nr:T6SS amidase immunity protein Tai4 family protein [Rheinheimera pleomorphica]
MKIWAVLTVFTLVMAVPDTAQAEMAFKQQNELKLFQYYAQASCLATAFTEGGIYDQAVSALNGYREFGAMPLEAYEALIAPIQQWLQKDYATQAGKQNNLMKCIDFAESEQLAEIFRVQSEALKNHPRTEASV